MTAHDLALWDESLMGRTILKPRSYDEMFSEVKTLDGKPTHYGLGVQIEDRNGHRAIEHGGEVTGFVSQNDVWVDDGVAVAVLTNHMAGGAEEIAHLVAGTVAGLSNLSNAEMQAIAIYRDLQRGQIERTQFAPNLNDYFSAQTVADFRDSLGPLGEPLSFHQTRESLRGGMTFRAFSIVYPTRRLVLTTYTYPDGKLEQYLVEPGD
jgi:D-alanyl-D-alanine carboxypeptidase